MRVVLGKSVYFPVEGGNPVQVGGDDRFVIVVDGHPVKVNRDQTEPHYVSYPQKRKARTTALALRKAGLDADVFDKAKGEVLPR